MKQERLNSLMLIFTKQKMTSKINVEEEIDEFVLNSNVLFVPIKKDLNFRFLTFSIN